MVVASIRKHSWLASCRMNLFNVQCHDRVVQVMIDIRI